MARTSKIISGIAGLLNELGYAVDEREPCPPLNIHVVAWRDRKPLLIPLGRWQDVWIVCTIGTEQLEASTERKKKLRELVEVEFAPKLLDIVLKDPFVNIVLLGEDIDPDKELEAIAPDRTRHLKSTFYSVTAFDVETQKIASACTWTGSVATSATQQAIAQILMGKSLTTQELGLLRENFEMK